MLLCRSHTKIRVGTRDRIHWGSHTKDKSTDSFIHNIGVLSDVNFPDREMKK